MQGIIDRIESGVAVVELDGGRRIELPASMLPPGAREGNVVEVRHGITDEGSHITLTLDRAGDDRRQAVMDTLRNSIREAPGGDITL
jgi:hypothetical protein